MRPSQHMPPVRTRPPNHRAWWIAAALVATMAAAAWFFMLRDTAPSSEFVRATDRYIAAVEQIREGTTEVSRFLDLPGYDDMVERQLIIMAKQTKVFERLARTERGEAARIARDAVDAANRGRFSASWYSESIISRRLTRAQNFNGELGAAVADLRLYVDQWESRK